MANYKRRYKTAAQVVYVAADVMDRAMPASMDDEAWKKWEAARSALYEYASHLQARPFNPVVKEAHDRGDYAYFLSQLERPFPRQARKVRGWSKKQVRKAIPIIRKLAEEAETGEDNAE